MLEMSNGATDAPEGELPVTVIHGNLGIGSHREPQVHLCDFDDRTMIFGNWDATYLDFK